jgi:hypothetical protein
MKSLFLKFIIFKILLFWNTELFAPTSPALPVEIKPAAEPFRSLIRAIGIVETGLDTTAYNPLEEAAGYFQIRPVRIEDYNRRTGSSYTLQDVYDYWIAEKIFLYYASKIGPYDFEKIAKNWNGSGSMTIDYWKKVKRQLNQG